MKVGDELGIPKCRSVNEYFDISINYIDRTFEYSYEEETLHADIIHNYIIFKININFNGTGMTEEEYNLFGEKNGDVCVDASRFSFSLYAYVNGAVNKVNDFEIVREISSYPSGSFILRPMDECNVELHFKALSEIFSNYPCYLKFDYILLDGSECLVPLNFDPSKYTDIPC